jgi:hypothetical protein
VLSKRSIKDLYPLALAEGEGVGTAYEYFAKRLLLAGWLDEQRPAPRVLIAGLPQKYGASLDFLLLADELGGQVTVVDERPRALQRLRSAVDLWAGHKGALHQSPQLILTDDLIRLAELRSGFDLVLSSEVLQRLPDGSKGLHLSRLVTLAPQAALFTPNADNDAHVDHSGLSGLTLEQLETAVAEGLAAGRQTAVVTSLRTGYVDMPPFPPGITRSAAERTQASTGKLEGLAMWGLGLYAQSERFVPLAIRKRQSHIVYTLLRLSPR